MVKGVRRLVAFLSALAVVGAIEIVNKYAGGGLSHSAQGALLGACAFYFGGVAADKWSRAKFGQGENEKD